MSTTSLDDHTNAAVTKMSTTSLNHPTDVEATAAMSTTSLDDHTNAAMSTTLPNDTINITMDLMSTVASKMTEMGINPIYYVIGAFTVIIILFVILVIIILLIFICKRHKDHRKKTGESFVCQSIVHDGYFSLFIITTRSTST
jgi:beta-lactamase regulating signal transducer with metallopeptidase domain